MLREIALACTYSAQLYCAGCCGAEMSTQIQPPQVCRCWYLSCLSRLNMTQKLPHCDGCAALTPPSAADASSGACAGNTQLNARNTGQNLSCTPKRNVRHTSRQVQTTRRQYSQSCVPVSYGCGMRPCLTHMEGLAKPLAHLSERVR